MKKKSNVEPATPLPEGNELLPVVNVPLMPAPLHGDRRAKELPVDARADHIFVIAQRTRQGELVDVVSQVRLARHRGSGDRSGPGSTASFSEPAAIPLTGPENWTSIVLMLFQGRSVS